MNTANRETVLGAHAVSKAFVSRNGPATLALRDVDLTLERHTFVSLLGPSGCGKSTLLRILGGLESPTSGEVTIASGIRSAFVFQEHSLFPWLSVRANVEFGLRMDGVSRAQRAARAREWIGTVGLAGFEDHYPEQLSGGMRQRLSLARAYVTDPDLLLMDEPMGALDPQTRRLIQEDLIRLWELTKKTVLLVTHDIDEALLLADRVVLMTSRPGTVKRDLAVGLSRPRTVEAETSPEFNRLKAEVWDSLRGEVERSLEYS